MRGSFQTPDVMERIAAVNDYRWIILPIEPVGSGYLLSLLAVNQDYGRIVSFHLLAGTARHPLAFAVSRVTPLVTA